MNVYICKGIHTHICTEITWLFFSSPFYIKIVDVRLMKFAYTTKLDELAPMLAEKPIPYRILTFVLMTGNMIGVRHRKCCEPLNYIFVGLPRFTIIKS